MQNHIINLYHTDCVYIRQKKWSLDLWYIEIALAVRPVDSFCMAAMCPDVQIKFLKYSNYLPCLCYVSFDQYIFFQTPKRPGNGFSQSSSQEVRKGKSWLYACLNMLIFCIINLVYTYAKRSDPLIFDTLR